MTVVLFSAELSGHAPQLTRQSTQLSLTIILHTEHILLLHCIVKGEEWSVVQSGVVDFKAARQKQFKSST